MIFLNRHANTGTVFCPEIYYTSFLPDWDFPAFMIIFQVAECANSVVSITAFKSGGTRIDSSTSVYNFDQDFLKLSSYFQAREGIVQ